MPRNSPGGRRLALFVLLAAAWTAGAACNWAGRAEHEQAARLAQPSRWGTPSVFTTAHRSAADAFRAFFDVRPDTMEQPVAFSHQLHLEKELVCTDCHEGVERGPVAGLPSVNTCLICHSQIATDRPIIQDITAMQEKGVDLAWRRVYGYTREAHVRFEHAPHIRAGVDCSTCHGDMRQQTVARRVVEMDMAFCVNCHTAKQASNDCLTCHY
ncbi:MAG: cytochrome c3 family protein [Acidobacteria bacterium]|nr:cytochrome c3 family protein [Acidobacteriota bacterium]